MQTPHLSPPLARFHEHGILSAAGLRRWLMRVPRSKGAPATAIEQGHGRWIASVRRAASRLADDLNRGPAFACRQALATSEPADLAAWRHVLGFGALDPFGDRASVSALIGAAEARWPSRRNADLEWFEVLSSASARPLPELLDAVRDSWPLWLALIRGAPVPIARKELLRFLSEQSGEVYGRGSYETTRIERVSASVASLLRSRPDVRLSAREFEVVPRRIVDHVKDPSLFMTEDALASLERRRIRREAAAVARAHRARERELRAKEIAAAKLQRSIEREARMVDVACAAIVDLPTAGGDDRREVRRRWQVIARRLRAIRGLPDGGRRVDAGARLTGAVQSLADRFHSVGPATASVQDLFRTELAGVAPVWLRFLSMSRKLQCLHGWPRDGWDRRRSVVSVPPALRAAIAESAVRLYLRDPSVRSKLWSSFKEDGDAESRKIWNGAFLVRRAIDPRETEIVLAWLESTTVPARDEFERIHGRWLDRIARNPETVRRLVEGEARRSAVTVLGLRDCRRFSTAMAVVAKIADSKKRVGAMRGLRALRSKVSDHGMSIADRIASEGLQALGAEATIALLGKDLSGERFLRLLESASSQTVAEPGAADLYRTIRSGRIRGLRTRFARSMREPTASARAAAGAWRSALACGEDDAVRLASEFPTRFVARAAKELSHAKLLARAVAMPSFAVHVVGAIGPDGVAAALPAARSVLAGKPGLRAVLELAVLSDIREIPHLRQLARSARRSSGSPAGHRFDDRYRTYELPKRSGGKRTISVPDEALMRLQRRLLAGAFDAVPLHDAAHGFRRGRSIVTNATAHVGKRLVVNVDIKGFFPSTLHASVLSACMKVDGGALSVRGAKLLADICCHRGALPTGAPTSPAIGNIVLRRADAAISAAAGRHGITYTRYADDLTFSGDGDCKRILPFVARVLRECGYELDGRKTQLYRRGRQQLVTNLVVNDKANLRRSDRKRLRAAVEHRCAGLPVTWHGRPMDDRALGGHIALLRMIDPATATAYLLRLRSEASEWGRDRE